MLDLETLGTTPGSVIFQLAALQFDPATGATGAELLIDICPRDAISHGLTTDADTLDWWASKGTTTDDLYGCTLTDAIQQLDDFIKDHPSIETIWAKGSDFDFPILAAAYRALDHEVPWAYYQQRCMRTAYQLSGLPRPRPEDIEHNALADCHMQTALLHAGLLHSRLTHNFK